MNELVHIMPSLIPRCDEFVKVRNIKRGMQNMIKIEYHSTLKCKSWKSWIESSNQI